MNFLNFDKERYKVYTWKNWMMLHWVLNPGLAFNELILGQRIPKIFLVDKTINKPKAERTSVPCPHCHVLHDARTWSSHNGTAFKNWLGLYCKDCGHSIPCITNVFSLLILGLTFPLWGWFRKKIRANWLANQPKRYKNIHLAHSPYPFDRKSWLMNSISFGFFMFVFMLCYSYLSGETLGWKSSGVSFLFWMLAGLLFGYSLKLVNNRSGSGKASTATSSNS